MREILFRGQRQSDCKWIYGDLLQPTEICDIYEISDCESIDGSRYDVIEYTIGQYTGLKDKNGTKIFEGDILIAPAYFGYLRCVCIYNQENIVSPIQGFGIYSYDSYFGEYRNLVESDEWDDFEVIGNIYDNAELLEEE